jgi:uncharacterized protein YlzI (FlbEa/FlbD family)
MAMLYGRTAQREETDVKLHEFTRSANGRVIRLNPEQISEMQAHPTENGVTVIWMASGNKIEVKAQLHEVLTKIGVPQ